MDDIRAESVPTTESGLRPDGPPPEGRELPTSVLRLLPERDPAALGELFDAYFDRVYAYVRRLVGEDHVAEDVTQEAFLQIYQALDAYDPARDLRPWVFTIATNKVRDFWRSRRHRESQREESVDVEGVGEALAADESRPEEELAREDVSRELREAVDRLPDGMRVTVLLRVYESLSFEAIGAILERNETAVRKRYSRAVDELRKALGARNRELPSEDA